MTQIPPPFQPFQPVPQYPARPGLPQRYGRIAALFLSFFSTDLYRDVGQRWRGIAFWYLALMLAVSMLPISIKSQIGVAAFANNEAMNDLIGFPAVTINKGVASIDRPEPYIWNDPQTHAPILYVDSTGAFDLPEGANAVMKLSASKLETKQDLQTRVFDLSKINYFYVDQPRIVAFLQAASKWVGLVMFFGGWVGLVIWHLLQILLYAAIGLAMAAMFGARLEYPALLRLAAVAITPAMLLSAVFDLTGTSMRVPTLIFLVLELGYLALAVYSNRQTAASSPAVA